ncbi:MAG: hypothetical protein IPK12_05400 [Gemmatimonadetes bacterium]|nr:hypothetical protein [Gemmatimonadota bacterium]
MSDRLRGSALQLNPRAVRLHYFEEATGAVSPHPELRDDQAILLVGTAGDWTIGDVQRFLSLFDHAYGTLLAVYLAGRRIAAAGDAVRWGPGALADYVARTAPSASIPLEPWQPQPEPAPVGVSSLDLPFGPEIRYLRFLYSARYELAPEAEPRILTWHMASPGSIQLVGLGDIILQIRELIKDLRYRNRQEQEVGDLEIARKRLELQHTVLSAPVADYVTAEVIHDAKAIRDLETRRRLIVGDTLASVSAEIMATLDKHSSQWKEADSIRALLKRFGKQKLPGARRTLNTMAEQLRELWMDSKIPDEQYQTLPRRFDDLYYAKVRAA